MTHLLWTIIIGGHWCRRQTPHAGPRSRRLHHHNSACIAGSFVASYLGQAMGWYAPGFIFSVIGAMILLLLYRIILGRRT